MNQSRDIRWAELLMSVGTHKDARRLSPVETAEELEKALSTGMSKDDLRRKLYLEDTSMIGRFLNLLKLTPEVRHLVDWAKRSPESLSFTVASEVAKLVPDDQVTLANGAIEYGMTSGEVKEAIQIQRRAGKAISECIQDVLKLRPHIEKKFVFIGCVVNDETIDRLRAMTQHERDNVLKTILTKHLPVDSSGGGHLGANRFSLVGDEQFATDIRQICPDFERCLNDWITEETGS